MSDKVEVQNECPKAVKDEALLANKYPARDRFFQTTYGQIGALEWGRADAPYKILCVHGWLDNAGSFERLVPFILGEGDNADKFHIISIDQPGCGLSSHKPKGADYNSFTPVVEMRRISLELGWDKLILLGHSLGSHYSFIYSCLWPKQVIGYVSIDLAHPLSQSPNMWNTSLANAIDNSFRYELTHDEDPTTNIKVPVYSEEDVIKRLMEAHSSSLSRKSAEVMLKRGAKKQRWGYTFTRDIRLRQLFMELKLNDDLMFQHMEIGFTTNLLVIRAKQSPYTRSEKWRIKYQELFKEKCPLYSDIIVDGTHHLHLNNPDLVAPPINGFLDKLIKWHQDKDNADNGSKL